MLCLSEAMLGEALCHSLIHTTRRTLQYLTASRSSMAMPCSAASLTDRSRTVCFPQAKVIVKQRDTHSTMLMVRLTLFLVPSRCSSPTLELQLQFGCLLLARSTRRVCTFTLGGDLALKLCNGVQHSCGGTICRRCRSHMTSTSLALCRRIQRLTGATTCQRGKQQVTTSHTYCIHSVSTLRGGPARSWSSRACKACQ